MATNLLQQIVNVEVHLENRLFSPFIMQCDDERSRRGRGDVEVNVGTPKIRNSRLITCPRAALERTVEPTYYLERYFQR